MGPASGNDTMNRQETRNSWRDCSWHCAQSGNIHTCVQGRIHSRPQNRKGLLMQPRQDSNMVSRAHTLGRSPLRQASVGTMTANPPVLVFLLMVLGVSLCTDWTVTVLSLRFTLASIFISIILQTPSTTQLYASCPESGVAERFWSRIEV